MYADTKAKDYSKPEGYSGEEEIFKQRFDAILTVLLSAKAEAKDKVARVSSAIGNLEEIKTRHYNTRAFIAESVVSAISPGAKISYADQVMETVVPFSNSKTIKSPPPPDEFRSI